MLILIFISIVTCNIAIKSNTFGAEVYRELSKLYPDENVVFSPFSLFDCLTTLLSGTDGDSNNLLRQLLNLEDDDEEEFLQSLSKLSDSLKLDIANGLFIKKDKVLLKSFIERMKKYYDVYIDHLNFEEPGRTIINNWIEEKTKGMIKDMIKKDVLSDATLTVIVNAIYFKQMWEDKFVKKLTESEEFKLFDKKNTRKVQMMNANSQFIVSENEDYSTCTLYYEGKDYKMIFVKPRLNTRKEFEKVEDIIMRNISSFLADVKTYSSLRKTHLKIPKFEIELGFSLKKILTDFGLDIFDIFKANFSRLIEIKPNESVFVTDVLQKGKIIVDEEGTEAAVATVIVTNLCVMSREIEKQFYFFLDSPFFYFIVHEETDLILFNGKYMGKM